MHSKIVVFLLYFLFLLTSCKQTKFKTIPDGKSVEIIEKNGSYQLYRNGSPYFIKGAVGIFHLEEIKKAGGNSIRIYDTKNAQEILDKAHKLGLTVTVGLQVAKAISEMDYGDEKAVQAQLQRLKIEVLRYKNHPALLMWGIGNEPTLHVLPSFTKPITIITSIRTWLAINEIAKMVHEIDPNHPTTTMLQGVPPKRTTSFISLFCKDIDILSFNIFLSLDNNVPELIKEKGWYGPYLLSEYGTLGYWFNIPQTDWYAVYEKSSAEKAAFIREAYQKYVLAEKDKCLGSYAFYWGQKNEFTSTWFSIFTEDGKQTEVLDALNYLWTNKWPVNRAPKIQSFKVNKLHPLENIYVKAGDNFIATIDVQDAEGEKLTLNWEILEDENDKVFNSVHNQKKLIPILEGELPLWSLKNTLPGKIIKAGNNAYNLKFKAPDIDGPYRLFMFIRDEQNKVATANAPFYVLPQP